MFVPRSGVLFNGGVSCLTNKEFTMAIADFFLFSKVGDGWMLPNTPPVPRMDWKLEHLNVTACPR